MRRAKTNSETINVDNGADPSMSSSQVTADNIDNPIVSPRVPPPTADNEAQVRKHISRNTVLSF